MLAWIARLVRRPPSGAVALAGWRDFGRSHNRRYHLLAACQGLVGVLAGFDVVIPFALDLGSPPAIAALLGALPVVGALAQLLVPRLLAQTDGNLRGLTLLAAALGDTRGLLYAVIALAVAAGVLGGPLALIVLAAVALISGALGSVATANLLAWHSAVLPEPERRLIVPRLMALAIAIGALLLLPIAFVLDGLADRFGMAVYAIPFGIAGLAGIAEVLVIRRLPGPGRVIVPPRALGAAAPETPEERQFLRVSTLNGLGMGVTPYLGLYAMSVLGLSAGVAMTMGAVNMLAVVVGATVAGAYLQRGSSAQLLRRSFALRAAAMAMPILALPGLLVAPLLIYGAAIVGGIGFACGQLAANERLFRLIRGPTVIRQHGRFLARTSIATVAGQAVAGGVLAIGGPLGYPAFALLYGASSVLRVVAHREAAPGRTDERRMTTEQPTALLEAGRSGP